MTFAVEGTLTLEQKASLPLRQSAHDVKAVFGISFQKMPFSLSCAHTWSRKCSCKVFQLISISVIPRPLSDEWKVAELVMHHRSFATSEKTKTKFSLDKLVDWVTELKDSKGWEGGPAWCGGHGAGEYLLDNDYAFSYIHKSFLVSGNEKTITGNRYVM